MTVITRKLWNRKSTVKLKNSHLINMRHTNCALLTDLFKKFNLITHSHLLCNNIKCTTVLLSYRPPMIQFFGYHQIDYKVQ